MVAALGYFVDIYDLILFAMVRIPSLKDLGVPAESLTREGIFLINMQMGGMMIGGILWGVLGDKRGRLAVLFGSITLYSLANLANGYTHSLDAYAACRLIAGIGLAGELGAGVTLVSELMTPQTRGVGTTLVAGVGVFGGVIAGLIGGALPSVWSGVDWRTAYYIGGGLGLALLALRVGLAESGMFHAATKEKATRGNFFALFTNGKRLGRYLAIIAVGVPVWFVIGILFTFCKEIGGALGMSPAPYPPTTLFFGYGGAGLGGLGDRLHQPGLRSRKRALAIVPRRGRRCSPSRTSSLGWQLADRVLRARVRRRRGDRLLGGVRGDRRGAVRHQPARDRHDDRAELRARLGRADRARLPGDRVDVGPVRDRGDRGRRVLPRARAGGPRACCPRRSAWTSTTSRTESLIVDPVGSVMFGSSRMVRAGAVAVRLVDIHVRAAVRGVAIHELIAALEVDRDAELVVLVRLRRELAAAERLVMLGERLDDLGVATPRAARSHRTWCRPGR